MASYPNGRIPASALAPIAAGWLRKDAAAAFNAMNVEARRLGVELRPTGSLSSYRDLAGQQKLYADYLAGRGALAAKPGTSNHGWGTAVDFATPQMRATVDRIGSRYGWSKTWSDAPGEWWHIVYRPGVWAGPDPGPAGQPEISIPTLPEATVALAVATMKDGRFEVFVEDKNGQIWHAYQSKEGGWAGAEAGKRVCAWYSLGTPGK